MRSLSLLWMTAPALALWAGPCRADGGDPPMPVTAAAAATRPAGATTTVDAPRLTHIDLPIDSAPRVPGWRDQMTELDYRWWSLHGPAAVGFGVGTLLYGSRPVGLARPTAGYVPGAGADAAPYSALAGSGTVQTLGMRYRTSERSTVYADAAGVRGSGDERDAVYGKVGIEFKGAQSRWNLVYGGLGLHLSGDTRMTVRLRRGGFALVMQRSF